MINILIAIGKVETLPEIGEEEELHIIAPENGMVPVSLLSYKNRINLHFLKKESDVISIAVLIGMIASGREDKVKLFCPTDALIKSFNGVSAESVEIIAAPTSRKTSSARGKRPRKAQVNAAPEVFSSVVGENEKVEEKKFMLLQEAGIQPEFYGIVLDAVNMSSDEEIGLEIQLKMKLAAVDKLDRLSSLLKGVRPIYKKLKEEQAYVCAIGIK